MFQVKADKTQNLLEIMFTGKVNAEEVKRCVDKVEVLLAGLKPGFALLNDLSALSEMDIDCAPHLSRSMDLCKKAGVGRIVRVIPDPRKDIGLNIMSRFHYPHKIPIVTCDTLEEAKKILSE